ncbi:MAG TPA: hypothetical protein VM165_21315, partial [Planctomycetaceae bacterium]|nr:hypothetical protein [Planctomycetaceae bacterium]
FRRPAATLVLNSNDQNSVALGRDVVLEIGNVPNGWSGAISVNAAQRIEFRSSPFRLAATPENGFKRSGVNNLTVVLLDRNGVEVPVKGADGRYQIITVPNVTVRPESQIAEAEPHSRTIVVAGRFGYEWAVSGQPEWLTIRSGASGTGDGKIEYDVHRNTTNEVRSARLLMGDASFEIEQRATVSTHIPFRERFSSRVPPGGVWMLDKRDHGEEVETTSRWFLDEQPGRHSAVTVESGGPGESNSLVIRSSPADTRPWATLLELPEIVVETDSSYVFTVFLKADVPGPVTISFTQRRPPYQNCGLSQAVSVTQDWTAFALPFKVTGVSCGAKDNRLALGTGRIDGTLSIANVSLEPAAAGQRLAAR